MSLIKHSLYHPKYRDEFISGFESLFDSMINNQFPVFNKSLPNDFFKKGTFPKVNVSSNNEKVFIEAALAGYKKEDISLEIKAGLLTISGFTPKSKKSSKKREYMFREVKQSTFSRTFSLNKELDADKTSASFTNGLLVIEIPFVNISEEKKEDAFKVSID